MSDFNITPPAVRQKSPVGDARAAENSLTEEQRARLKKACADFEAIFYYYMLKSMRNTVPKSGLMSGFPGKDTFSMMFDQKMSEEMAKSNSNTGLQKALYNQMVKAVKNSSAR